MQDWTVYTLLKKGVDNTIIIIKMIVDNPVYNLIVKTCLRPKFSIPCHAAALEARSEVSL